MNKRGYLKTLEAIIAIILLLVVFYTIIPKYVEPKPTPPLAVQDAQRFIISDISNNEELRTTIITTSDPSDVVEATIKKNMPPNYDFVCAICTNTSACVTTTPFDKVVYMSDVFIASSVGPSLAEQSPKIIRFWMWNKPTENLPDKNTCKVVQ
ncbi:MAG: hypothetical protein QW404_03585 [Candidatus Nanoarchaeia archaeon]